MILCPQPHYINDYDDDSSEEEDSDFDSNLANEDSGLSMEDSSVSGEDSNEDENEVDSEWRRARFHRSLTEEVKEGFTLSLNR